MSELPPRTIRKIVGVGVLIQFISLIAVFQAWRHHHNFYYILPVSLVGFLVATVPAAWSKRSSAE